MRMACYIFVLLTLAGAGLACGQTPGSPMQTAPPASLIKLDATSAEVLYHDRNDRVIILKFLVTPSTQKANVQAQDTVLISYFDRNADHVAQSIVRYIPAEHYHSSSRPSGGVGGVASMARPVSTGPSPSPTPTGSSASSMTSTIGTWEDAWNQPGATPYSREGAEALKSEMAAWFSSGSHLTVASKSGEITVTLASLRQKGFAIAPANGECEAVNVWESGKFHYSCYGSSNESSFDLAMSPGSSIDTRRKGRTLHPGDLVGIRDMYLDPEGLSLSLIYAGKQRDDASILRIPFTQGELPTQKHLEELVFEVVGIAPSESNQLPDQTTSEPQDKSKKNKAKPRAVAADK